MKNIKRFLAFLMAICMMFTLYGCNSSDEWEEYSVYEEILEDDAEDTESDEGEKLTSSGGKKVVKKKKVKVTEKKDEGLINSDKLTPQEELFAKSSLKGTTLTYVKGSEYEYPQEKYAIKQLEEKWGIKCKYVIYANTALPSMIASMVASGNPPDVAHAADTNLFRYAYTNLATPLNDYIVMEDPVWDGKETFAAATYNGNIYGIPWGAQLTNEYYVWYNKTYLKEIGAEDPYELYKAGKWNDEAFKRVAKQAVKYESDGKTVKTYGAMCWNPSVFLALYGEQAVTEQSNGSWKVTIDSEAGMKGLQLIHDMYADDSLKLDGGYKEFGTRKTAMILERSTNAIENYDYYNKMEDEIGLVPLPSTQYGSYGFTNIETSFVLKGSKNPMAAVAYRYYDRLFIAHTSDAEKKAAGYEVTGAINISDEHKKIVDEYKKSKMTKLLDSKLYSLTNWTTGDRLSAAFWKDLTENGKQPAQLVDSVKDQIKNCLKNTVGASNVIN